jgi:hypothetical protein
MKKCYDEVCENIPDVTSCEDQTDNSEAEKLCKSVDVNKKKGKKKKILLCIIILIVACICFVIGRYLYNNGEVTNRTITLNIDLRDIEGKYTGTITDGLPNGDGTFIYTVGDNNIKIGCTGTFSEGMFLNGDGSLLSSKGNIVYQGKFKYGLPDKEEFEKCADGVTGQSVSEWAINKNLFKCYNQTGSIIQVNRWAGTENGVCLTVVTGGNNNGKAIRVFYENSENINFYEGNLVNWIGRLIYVENGEYPQAVAYFVETFTETALRQQMYNSILNAAKNSGFAIVD